MARLEDIEAEISRRQEVEAEILRRQTPEVSRQVDGLQQLPPTQAGDQGFQLPQFGAPPTQADPRQLEAMGATPLETTREREQALAALPPERRALIESISPLEAGLIGAGRGMMTIGRGLGLAEPEEEFAQQAIEQLRTQQPIAVTGGEIAGEAAPFLAPGLGVAAIPGRVAQVAGAVGLGAAEAGLITRGRGEDVGQQLFAAGVGGTVAGALDVAIPVIGRIGGKIIRKLTGKDPVGAVIDAAGRPSPELVDALQKQGLTFDDLMADTVSMLKKQKPGADPEQLARATLAKEIKIPLTKGELTQEFSQQATEQRLLESASDPIAERFRQFKLGQSQTIREGLEKGVDTSKLREETGELITDALTGRKKLLRTTKNSLYGEAAENAKDIGGIPMFTDDIEAVIPSADDLEDLAITAPQAMASIDGLLKQWGLKEGAETPRQLTIENFERFRKNLNAIDRGDPTGASKVVTSKIRAALDEEADNLAATLAERGIKKEVLKPLMEARKTVKQLKREFSPQAFTGRLTDVKRDGITPIIESSQVYSKISSKAQPVENVRKLMNSLDAAGEKGAQAIGDLQSTVMMDLIDAGFGTASRKIDGIPVFNPGAFKKRIKMVGMDKIQAIFKDNKQALKQLRNIDRLSADLIPPSGAMPKGSASVIMDLMNKLGVIGISSKLPGGAIMIEAFQKLAEGGKSRAAVEAAIAATPDILPMSKIIDETYPGISKALGLSAIRAAAPIAALPQQEQQ